ncbi:Na+/H+ antiporter NhaA [Actinomadura latina]|uniref:Na+/H+ antiporter NhaA n=1 Tax=Actinomadura latina TaxID=163603 RepID=UPI00289AFE22|nr:Na+/H+ antiporter NhaA [Actinomadura latina]
MAPLAGVGFTVSLLIGGLAYTDPSQFERVTTAVLIASVLASAAAAVVFRRRVRVRAPGLRSNAICPRHYRASAWRTSPSASWSRWRPATSPIWSGRRCPWPRWS